MVKFYLSLLFFFTFISVFSSDEINPFSHEIDYRVNLVTADYERQFDSIYNALVSNELMREIEENSSIKVDVGGIAGFDTLIYEISKEGDFVVSIKNKDIEECVGDMTSDYDPILCSWGDCSSYSLSNASDFAYIEGLSFLISEISRLKLSTSFFSFVKSLYDWKREMFLAYKFIINPETELKICENYAYRNGIYTVYMLFNIQRDKLQKTSFNVDFDEADFDRLYESDKTFQKICSLELETWRTSMRELGYILVAYELVAEKCESCPTGWKLVKLNK